MIAVIIEDSTLQLKMLEDGYPPKAKCRYLGYPLEMACRLGLKGTVSRLIEAGLKDDETQSVISPSPRALLAAVKSNHTEIVRMLLESHTYSDQQLRVAADAALEKQQEQEQEHLHKPEIREILGLLASVDASSVAIPFIKAAAQQGWDDIIKFYAEDGETSFETLFDSDSWPPILDSIKEGLLSTSELLISAHGGDTRRSTAHNAHLAAALSGNIPFFEYHLSRVQMWNKDWPSVTSRSEVYYVPIIAAMKGHVAMLKYALDKQFHTLCQGLRVQAIQNCAFIAAIYNGQCETVEVLIRHFNLDVNAEFGVASGPNLAPLLLAIDAGSIDMARLLVRYGASVDAVLRCRGDGAQFDFSWESRVERWKMLRERLTGHGRFFTVWRLLEGEYKVERRKVDSVVGILKKGKFS